MLLVGVLCAQPALAAPDAATVIDWSKGPVQATEKGCGLFRFTNLADKAGYTLWVKGTASGTCSFQAEGMTFHLPSNHGSTTAGRTTAYYFTTIGHDVLVSWSPDY